jgi:hypothetical protein
MAKMTAKYAAAWALLRKINFPSYTIDIEKQDEVYGALQDRGFMWDSTQKEWIDLGNEPADEPTKLVMVRVWADQEVVQEAADEVSKSLKRKGFDLVETSPVYPCRPPKQLEGRVYLKLLPPKKGS